MAARVHSFPTRRSSDLGHAGEVGGDGRDVVEVHGQRVVDLLPEAEGRRRRRRGDEDVGLQDRKSTRLNSSHVAISYAVFCLKKKVMITAQSPATRRGP